MDNFAHLFQGFAIAFTPVNLLTALVGAFMGIVVGAMPGIGSLAGCSLLLPRPFHMDPTAISAPFCSISPAMPRQ